MNRSTFDAVRAGDEQAFRELTAPHLRELHVHPEAVATFLRASAG